MEINEPNGISVIVAVYNSGLYLRYCLESILKQSFSLFEIVLIDDGSNDQTTLDIIAEYSNNTLFRIIHIKNSGVSFARNLGIKESKYGFVTFIDGDDVVSKDYLTVLFKIINETNSDISSVGVEKFLDGETVDENLHDSKQTIYDKNQAVEELLKGGIKGYCCGKLFRKALLDNIWFDTDIKIMEDHCFVNSAINKSNRVVCSNLNLYFYRIHNASATQKFDKNKLLSIHKAVKFLLKNNDPMVLGKCKASLINTEVSMLFVLASHNSLDKETYRDAVSLINDIKRISDDRIVFSEKKYALKYHCLKLGRHIFIILSYFFRKVF